MKKIIIGVFVLTLLIASAAQAERRPRSERNDDTATSTKSELRKELRKKAKNNSATSTSVDATCVSGAVAEREEAILGAWSTLNTEVVNILEARKSALSSAWAMSDAKERKVALKEAWATAKKERKEAAGEYKTTKKEAWGEFKQAAKECGGGVGSEAAGESEAGEKLEI